MDDKREEDSSNELAESRFLEALGAQVFERDRLPDLQEIISDKVTYVAGNHGNLLLARVFSVAPVDLLIELRGGGQIGVASGSFDGVGQPIGQPWRIMGSLLQGSYMRVRCVVFGDRVEHRFITAGEGGVANSRLSLKVVEPSSSEVVSGEAVSEVRAYPILRTEFHAKVSANGKAAGAAHTLFVNINGKDHVDTGVGATSVDVNDVRLPAAAALHARIVSPRKERVRFSVQKVIFS